MDKNVILTLTLPFTVSLPAIAALQPPAVATHTCLVSSKDLSVVPLWNRRGWKERCMITVS